MVYSRWSDSFFYTAAQTGAPHISASKLQINPRIGDSRTVRYDFLADIDSHWVALNFPDTPMHFLSQLVKLVKEFRRDMEHNVYPYKGFKQPTW
jgi:hypothetical protein